MSLILSVQSDRRLLDDMIFVMFAFAVCCLVQARMDGHFFRGLPRSAFDLVRRNYAVGRVFHWSGITQLAVVDFVGGRHA